MGGKETSLRRSYLLRSAGPSFHGDTKVFLRLSQLLMMKRILCSDWLPERARWAYLARSGLPALVPQKRNSVGVIFWPYNRSFIDQACSVKMAGYWPSSFLRVYGPRLRLGL